METPLVLGYWAIRGLGERIRLLLEYCGLPYVEEKYSGPEGRERWNSEVKPQLVLQNPAATLPYLKDGDRLICESDAICIYIIHKANKLELLGRTVDEKVAMATAWGVFRDTHIQFVGMSYYHHGHPTIEAAIANFPFQIQPYINKLSGLLGEQQFIAGGITYADFAIAEFLQALELLDASFVAKYPELKAYQARVWALAELKDYFASRFQERPVFNYMAGWK